MSERLFVNAKVFTGRGERDFTSAFRIADGQFSWVGDAAAVRGEPATDLGGRTVLPGLLDVHTHPAVMASLGEAVNCLPPAVTSLDQLIERLRMHPNIGAGPDRWVLGSGYDDSKFAEGRPPTRYDLDEVSASQPVIVRRCDGHTAACNSRALELAGITADTPDPLGARFERDPAGHPNGLLTELGAVRAVMAAMPAAGPGEQLGHLAQVGERLLARGIVAVCDLLATALPQPLAIFRDAGRQGFRPRCTLFYAWNAGRPLPDLTQADRLGRIRIGGLKLFMDGAYSNRTAWVREPYPGSDAHGIQTLADADARAAVEWARRNQAQVAVHAMGDLALDHVVEMFGDEEPWLSDRPSIRLEHATLVTRELIAKINQARMSFAIVTHTIFFFAEYEAYRRNLHPHQAHLAYPLRALYDTLPLLALSSDCPATAWDDADNVFVSVMAAVQRRSHSGGDIGQMSAITVPQALLLYTGRARQVADLGPVGIIAPGFEGSFVVLDRDVFTIPAQEIGRVRVAETWLGGERVYALDTRGGTAHAEDLS